MKKTTSNFESVTLQKIFLACAILPIAASMLMQAWFTVRNPGPDFGFSDAALMFVGVGAPLLSFGIAYGLHRATSIWLRLFDSMLIAVAATGLYGILSQISIWILPHSGWQGIGEYLFYELIVVLVITGLTAIYLTKLKQAKKW